MIVTSQELIETMRQRIVTTSAKVQIIDNTYNDGSMFEMGKYAIFEDNGIDLDGSCNTLEEDREIEGWYGDILSDENGSFQDDIEYSNSVSNSRRQISDLHILFSNIRDEFAVDFDVIVNSTTYNFTGNTKKEVILNNITTGSQITIKIYKWSKKFCRAKVLNIYLGTAYLYEDDEIVSINVKKGVDLINEEIQSKEIEIKLTDTNDEYNIFNNSEWNNFDTDTRMQIFLGALIDNFIYYVKVDECYFKKVEKKNDELAITVTGIGIITKYQDVNWYKMSEIYFTPKTLENILDKNIVYNQYYKLFEKIKIDNEIIQEEQKIITCFEKEITANEYFNELATNCRSNLIETYDNNIQFKRIKIDNPVARIDLTNMENEPEIEKKENNFNILIKKYNYYGDGSEEQEEVYKGTFIIKDSGQIYLNPYKSVEFLNGESVLANVSFVANIYNKDGSIYARNITESSFYQYFKLMILPNAIIFYPYIDLQDKTLELTFNCTTIIFTSYDYEVINSDMNREEKTIDIRSIQDEETANKIGEWLVSNLNKRFRYRIKINDAFTYELGDTVELETGVYINEEMVVRKAIVTGIEYEYNGTLDYYLILEGE